MVDDSGDGGAGKIGDDPVIGICGDADDASDTAVSANSKSLCLAVESGAKIVKVRFHKAAMVVTTIILTCIVNESDLIG